MAHTMNELFKTDGFMPRGACGQTDIWLLFINLADILIFAAYFAIPLSILYFWKWRFRFSFEFPTAILVWYSIFIVACGTTHLLDALMTWWPAYWVDAVGHWVTAFASWSCAISTWFETRKTKK